MADDPYASFSSPAQQQGADPYASFSSAAPAQAAPVQEAPKKQSLWDQYINSAYSPVAQGEAIANVGSSMLAGPVSGLAGLGTAATNAVGLTNTPAADVVNRVGGAMTYQPRTEGGQQIAGAVAYPFEKLAQGARAVAAPIAEGGDGQPRLRGPQQAPAMAAWQAAGRPRSEGSPLLATTIDTAIQAAPALLTRGRGGEVPKAVPKPIPEATPRQIAVSTAVEKKLKITPDQAGDVAGGVAQGLTGGAKLERSNSLKNAPRVNELVAEDLGLKGKKEITKNDLVRLKVEANKPYNEISRTGERKVGNEYRNEVQAIGDKTGGKSFAGDTPQKITDLKKFYSGITKFDAADAVNKVRQLRKEGRENAGAKYDPEKNALGEVQLKIAEAIDNELSRHVDTLGKPELAAKYKDARVQLAKINTVERALRGSDVSARALAKDKGRGAFTGNIKTVSDLATEFERSFQDVRKIRDQGPLSVVDYVLGVGGATANPALAAAVLARPAVRGVLSSDMYQRGVISKRGRPAAKAQKAPASNALKTVAATNALSANRERR